MPRKRFNNPVKAPRQSGTGALEFHNLLFAISLLEHDDEEKQTKSGFREMAEMVVNEKKFGKVTLLLPDGLIIWDILPKFYVTHNKTEPNAASITSEIARRRDQWLADNETTITWLKKQLGEANVSVITWSHYWPANISSIEFWKDLETDSMQTAATSGNPDLDKFMPTALEVKNEYRKKGDFFRHVNSQADIFKNKIKDGLEYTKTDCDDYILRCTKRYILTECVVYSLMHKDDTADYRYQLYCEEMSRAMLHVRKLTSSTHRMIPLHLVVNKEKEDDLKFPLKLGDPISLQPQQDGASSSSGSSSDSFGTSPPREDSYLPSSLDLYFSRDPDRTYKLRVSSGQTQRRLSLTFFPGTEELIPSLVAALASSGKRSNGPPCITENPEALEQQAAKNDPDDIWFNLPTASTLTKS